MTDNVAVSVGGNAAMIFSGSDRSNPVRDVGSVAIANLPEELQFLAGASTRGSELGAIDVTNVPLRKFSGFEAYNVDVGMSFWQHMRNDDGQLGFIGPGTDHAHDARSLVEDFKLWNVYGDGIFTQYTTQVDFVNGLIVGNPQNPIPAVIGANAVEGRGHGISGNDATQDLLFRNLRIEGFEEGVRLPKEGTSFVGSRLEDSYLANNTFHLAKDTLHRERSPEPFPDYFEIADTTFVTSATNLSPTAAFSYQSVGGQGVVSFDASNSLDSDPAPALALTGNAIAATVGTSTATDKSIASVARSAISSILTVLIR
ncbi:MAG: hypothetical protein HC925_05585 [Coleofasciculaceae cyanobacterium SM2_3_26]|nr:hypothetical protein [Coleofasciculaceae cyanobacterium SM2_3_26]